MTCNLFGTCGGCRLYDLGYEGQLEQKVKEVGALMAPFDLPEPEVFRSFESHYRNRVEFKVIRYREEGGRLTCAMRHISDKNRLVPVVKCPIAHRAIYDLMEPFFEAVKEDEELHRRLVGIDYLSSAAGEIVVTLIYHRKLHEPWNEAAAALAERFGVDLIGRSKGQKIVIGKEYVTETLHAGGRDFTFKHIENTFTQPNGAMNEKMVNWAIGHSKGFGGDLVELYAGMGNFTLPLAMNFRQALATEVSKGSVRAARENIEANGVDNVTFVRMSSEEFTQAMEGVRPFTRLKEVDLPSYDLKTVLVDPPRSGLDPESVKLVQKFENILYISCNPETLAENLAELTKTHQPVAFALFDQFPYTPHIESGVVLRKR